jgi:hypothetical protein
MPIFRGYFQTNRAGENRLLGRKRRTVLAFLWRAHAQETVLRRAIGECNAIKGPDWAMG